MKRERVGGGGWRKWRLETVRCLKGKQIKKARERVCHWREGQLEASERNA